MIIAPDLAISIENAKQGITSSGGGCIGTPGTGTFFGTIFESDGTTPVPFVVIYFCASGTCYTTTADPSGVYSTLPEIASGVYTIRAAKVGVGFTASPNHVMIEPNFIQVDLLLDSPYQDPICP